MKNIVGWIIAIIIMWFVFFGFNSIFGSDTTTSITPNTSPINSYDYSDEDIESDQNDEDVNINNDSLEYNGYPCTVDCSGHEAGYEWAEENGITQDDVDSYSGNSNSFMEGMQSYVDEN
ncbi:hypothetical protein KKF69_00820 [Patescibacteria group bacterium]|nr:hypothetical protein [Patescibacteria group bacterium]